MDNKLYDKVITKLQDKDTPKIELKDYGFYKNAAVTFIKDSKVYYAVSIMDLMVVKTLY